jgi:hypothetical protein
MLLFDDSKKLEKALGEEAAAVIVHILEKADEKSRQELATKADLEAKLREFELRLEYRLTVCFGAMLTAAVAILAALMIFLK